MVRVILAWISTLLVSPHFGERSTWRYNGRDLPLTDVATRVVRRILA